MIHYDYSLCGIPIRVECAEPLPLNGDMDAFRRTDGALPAIIYCAGWYDGEPDVSGEQVLSQVGYFIQKTSAGYTYYYNVGGSINPHRILLAADPAAGEYRLQLPETHRALLTKNGMGLAPLLGHDLLFVSHDRLYIHSSFIRWRGQGLMFTGPSGMGKSTQAGLWEWHMGAEVLNGDKTVVHLGGEVTAWGSPYAGTSGIYRNESAPLRGIVSLRQAAENHIVRLHGREALMELMPRMGTIPWAGEWHVKAMDLAIALVSRVPVWRLSCRPDEAAAELTRRTVFGE